MKKTCHILLVGFASLVLAGAQTPDMQSTSSAATNQPVAAEAAAATAPATDAAAASTTSTNMSAMASATKAQAATATTNMNLAASPAETNAPAGQPPQPAAATNSTLTAASNGGTNTAVPVSVGIPQIRFSDVPLTTAIENLARLAHINYMLDPKIGYGKPDKNGQIKVEPTLSIRWENITAKNALLALLGNYGLQLVEDKKTGIDRITLQNPAAPPPLYTKVIQLKYAGVSNILASAQAVLTDKRSHVMADPRTSQLIVVATDPEQEAVASLVNDLDKPTRQVLIETKLVEISSNPETKKGVDWTGTLKSQQVTFGNGNSAGTFTTTFPGTPSTTTLPGGRQITSTPGSSTSGTVNNNVGGGGFSWTTKNGMLPDIGFLNADGVSAVLSFLNSSSEAQVMSTPRIVTLDNQEATISVTRGYPVFNISAGTANTAGGSQVSYTNVGTILHVTPRISANDYIWLKVVPEVSSFFGNFQQTIGGVVYTAPLFDTRKISTQVVIPNANTLVMGGLVQDNPNVSTTKVPLLGDIPGLGFFFRSSDKSLTKDNLLIFITPTIIKDSDFQVAPKDHFLKSKPVLMKDPMNPNTAWDGPVPAGDWSNPISNPNE